MNKSELIKIIYKENNFKKSTVHQCLNSIISIIKEKLLEGENINITGFGSFYVKHRKERQGRNPKTGEKMTIKASKIPVFRPGKTFKQEVNS